VSQEWKFTPEKVETWQESATILDHVKAVIRHSIEKELWQVDIASMSKEVGVFSAMALNRFEEAQSSLDQSLTILDHVDSKDRDLLYTRASALHEIGRVFRYVGNYQRAEDSLAKALKIRRVTLHDQLAVAETLHELGVLEVKKHNLDSAACFLQEALEIRRTIENQSPGFEIEAACASTLHQLAAVSVALKPPSLDRAELLLKEALALNMQIGQRAATLKQLARAAIRRGDFDTADQSLAQALELYVELYGENTLHINVAAVKFQQGALAFQREQYEQAWLHFSECLRARRHVYAFSQGNHLEVSSVYHELGCVAFAQKRFSRAAEMLSAEKVILDRLYDTSSERQRERLLQARLTNLTWLRKCAKEQGVEEEVRKISEERSNLKRGVRCVTLPDDGADRPDSCAALERECLSCRLSAREFALSSSNTKMMHKEKLLNSLQCLKREIDRCPACSFRQSVVDFYETTSSAVSTSPDRATILQACDKLRDELRDQGIQVRDKVQRRKR
jgi:tetratricopeptide (TPR) repeat protein